MDLGGQARSNEAGYAMVALLVAMGIVALLMTAAMPVWKQMNQREKEEELVFRGQQYVHAIALYGRKFANTQPPSVDVLVQQKFLRKKYKDPITDDDFQLVMATAQAPGSNTPGGATQPGASRGGSSDGSAAGSAGTRTPGQMTAPGPPQTSGRGTSPTGTQGGPVGGIIGVSSKSKEKSIRLYNGRTHYNEWVFMYQPQQVPGASAPGAVPGGVMPGVGGTNPRGNTSPFPGGGGPFGGRGRDGRGGGTGGGPGGPRGPGFPGGSGGPTTQPTPGRGRL